MSHRPDRPIADPAADRLGRDGFVARLARALVREESVDGRTVARASGVVVGLTGPWGSGKSSLLNLLQAEIEKQHPDAVVVRFDPWLVSGRDDVITQFFAELIRQIQEVGTNNPQVGKVATRLTGRLTKYAANLAPATAWLGLPIPGLREALKAVGDALDHPESLAAQRTDLITSLAGVEVPIVVLIDELDRVEDAEVRAVAQLVRAVADFPGLSYLLAYDRDRVVEALGGGNAERGGAYLEKIVQLEIPFPISVRSETRSLFTAEFESAAPVYVVPSGWRSDPRYLRLLAIATDGLLTTPRDIRRVCGMYAVLAPMVAGEVDWLDLLGYCILLAKAPAVVEAIRRQPRLAVRDAPVDRTADINWVAFSEEDREGADKRLSRLEITPETPIAGLLALLFPDRLGTSTRGSSESADCLRYYRPLMTVLRLGLLPGSVSRSDIQQFLGQDGEAMLSTLRARYADQTLDSFLERLRGIYHELGDIDARRTLFALGRMVRDVYSAEISHTKSSGLLSESFGHCRWFDDFLSQAVREGAVSSELGQAVLAGLIEAGHLDVPTRVLRHHFVALGLFSQTPRDTDEAWLPADVVENLADKVAGMLLSRHEDGTLFSVIHTPDPFFLAQELGRWTPNCRETMTNSVRCRDDALRDVTALFFDFGMVIPRADLEAFLDVAVLQDRLRRSVEDDPSWPARAERSRRQALHQMGGG